MNMLSVNGRLSIRRMGGLVSAMMSAVINSVGNLVFFNVPQDTVVALSQVGNLLITAPDESGYSIDSNGHLIKA